MLSILFTLTGCISIDPPSNPLAIDDDGDGYTEFEGDCDDQDPSTFPGSATEATSNECMKDDDGDGFGDLNVTGYFDAGTDCDDSNPQKFPGAAEKESDSECLTDEDEDGWSAEVGDCNDSDSSMPNSDIDCDGVLSVYDCDDNDASMPNSDMDCDGVLRVDDCDDGDSSLLSQSNDMDCDGVLSDDDCDDNDASTVNDMDCDGVLSADDCDDNDASLLSQSNDMDCDGVLSDDDCDDNDASLLSQSNDMDCDGVLSVDDCDDNDASMPNIDMDCDGVLSVDDCDDGDATSTVVVDDGDCDGVLSVDDCDDGDANVDTVCVELSLGGGQSMDLALIPSGSDPQGRYTITSDFYLMTTEVTQGMFTALMSYDPTTYSTTYGVGNDYPAYYVSWHMAADFANKVTQRHNSVNGTSLQECYSCSSSGSTSVTCTEAVNPYQCSGYVLPTEAEWEYAARSGTQYDFWTPDGGGNYNTSSCDSSVYINDGVNNPLLSDYGWFCGNASSSKEVGQKLPNGFGLYDMHGNLWEWTADRSGCGYPQASTDPYCSSAGSYRVTRGGTWGSRPVFMRASGGNLIIPVRRDELTGFRLGLHP